MAQTIRNEVWKEIEGYEGLYQVSTEGQVRSLNYNHTGKTKILQQDTSKRGYKRVRLSKNGKTKPYSVHRLVAQAFISNPNSLPCINHKDENPSNNCSWNLEWCSYSYNNNYGTRAEKISKAKKGIHRTEATIKKISTTKKGKYTGKNNPNAKAVLMFTLEGEFIRRFDCIVDACKYLGKKITASSNITNCARGKYKSCYGYIFKYEEVSNID